MPGPETILTWSTDQVPPDQRLDYWVGAICEAFLELDAGSREADGFGGVVRSVPVQELVFSQVLASSHDVYRTPAAISRGRSSPFYLVCQMALPWSMRQSGHLLHLRPGDAVLVDAGLPTEVHFPRACGCLAIALPRPWVGRWLRQVDSHAPRIIWREQGWGRTLSALCLQLGEDLSQVASYPQGLLLDHLGALLAACLEPSEASGYRKPDLAGRARALMRQQLDQAGLSTGDLARELQVSARTLHRAFSAQGITLAGSLRDMRMRLAAQLLARDGTALALSEVASRCGYSDASHFGREFRRFWGAAPARWRRDSQAGEELGATDSSWPARRDSNPRPAA